jgi:acyl carrier protein
MASQAVCVADKQTVSLSLFVRNAAKDEDAIRHLLGDHLPEYMVPDLVLEIDEFPRLSNGKIDAKALRSIASDKRQVPYVAPSNETEQKLAAIWQDCLDHPEPVGVNSDFFTIGGHSLVAIKVISRIVEAFSIKLSVHDLFENNTIAQLAQRMEEISSQTQADDTPAIVATSDLDDDDTEEFEL